MICTNYTIYRNIRKQNFNVIFIFIYFQVLGPKLMENRKPFQLRGVLIIYNFIQVIFSFWLFYEACISGWLTGYSLRCQPVDYSTSPKALRVGFCHYFKRHYIIIIVFFTDGSWLLVVLF